MQRLMFTTALVFALVGCHKAAPVTEQASAAPASAAPASAATAASATTPATTTTADAGTATTATDAPAGPPDKYAAGSTADVAVLGDASAWALSTGCLPLGALPTYEPDPPTRRPFEHDQFQVAEKTETDDGTRDIAGRYCKVSYAPKSGTDSLSDLEIQSNYRDQLTKLGAEILYTDNRDTYALLNRQGVQIWVSVYSQETEITITVIDRQPFKSSLVAASGNDYPLLGHLPGYVSDSPTRRKFDQMEFDVGDSNGDSHKVNVQGAKYVVRYEPDSDTDTRSDLDIQDNYRDALKTLGAQSLYTDNRNTTARLDHDGKVVWVSIYSQETGIEVSTIEEKSFQASIQPPTADALKAALDKDGHVALYINFDFNKASLRPDAAPIIAQVTALLRNNPGLKLSVQGNTDNIGGHDYNARLSQERAAAVVAALVGKGIAADRLQAAGNGPDKPIADNATAEGRARNRRVELVKA